MRRTLLAFPLVLALASPAQAGPTIEIDCDSVDVVFRTSVQPDSATVEIVSNAGTETHPLELAQGGAEVSFPLDGQDGETVVVNLTLVYRDQSDLTTATEVLECSGEETVSAPSPSPTAPPVALAPSPASSPASEVVEVSIEIVAQAGVEIDCDSVEVTFFDFPDAPANSAEVSIGIDPGGGGTEVVTWDGPEKTASWPVQAPGAPIARKGTVVDVEVDWDTNGQQGRIVQSETLGRCKLEPSPVVRQSPAPSTEFPDELAATGSGKLLGLLLLVASLLSFGVYALLESRRRAR